MKTLKTSIIACFLLLGIASCKKDGAQKDGAAANTESDTQVVVDMTVKKDDIFEVFYVEDESLNFGPKSVRVDVKGKETSQSIVFNIPDDPHLGNLRLDIGQNPEQEEMVINNMVIKQGDKEMVISGADFFTHFTTTDYVKIHPEKLSMTTEKVKDVYDPFLYGNTTLMNALREFNK